VRQSLLAVVFSLLGIIIYVAFRFKNWVWGAAGVLALAHDVFLTVGFLSVTDRELTITVIASLLTLAGYSINDTIVIFDRIRENLRMRRKEPLDALINRSLNETLSRTIITSGMVFFVLLALLFFGGEVLNDFAAALTFGVVVGSYSTWFIAVPLVFDWQTRRARPPQR
jgi:preprotein translocase subunit SecF